MHVKMKYAILATGLLAAAFFIYSVYIFAVEPTMFKKVAYGFLGFTIIFFVLVIIRKLREDKEYRRKTSLLESDIQKKEEKKEPWK